MFCTSVTLSVFLPEQLRQTEQDGSRHHQQTDNHCRRNREVNAGLNDGRVGDACELLRRDVGFVNGERDFLVGSGIAVQRADFADQIAARNEIISAYNAVFIGNQLSNERPLVVIQTEANAGKRFAAVIRFLELVMVRDVDQRNRLVVLPVVADVEDKRRSTCPDELSDAPDRTLLSCRKAAG